MSPAAGTELAGRVALVTGGGAGIGAACAAALAAAGAAVAVVDRDEAAAAGVATACGAGALAIVADVGETAACDRAVRIVLDVHRRLDILVNNAGIQRYGSVLDTTDEVWDEVMRTNLGSVARMSRAAGPHLQAGGAGSIVNIASVQSFAAQPRVAAYAASKGAVLQLTRSMAVDLAPSVRVNAVCPGSVDTPMLRWAAQLGGHDPDSAVRAWGESYPMGRVASAEEVAQVVLFLASPRSSFVTGTSVVVDGGLTVQLP